MRLYELLDLLDRFPRGSGVEVEGLGQAARVDIAYFDEKRGITVIRVIPDATPIEIPPFALTCSPDRAATE